MADHKGVVPKRHDRFRRIVVDYAEAGFHQNEEILKILREMRDLLKKAVKI